MNTLEISHSAEHTLEREQEAGVWRLRYEYSGVGVKKVFLLCGSAIVLIPTLVSFYERMSAARLCVVWSLVTGYLLWLMTVRRTSIDERARVIRKRWRLLSLVPLYGYSIAVDDTCTLSVARFQGPTYPEIDVYKLVVLRSGERFPLDELMFQIVAEGQWPERLVLTARQLSGLLSCPVELPSDPDE